MTIQMKEVEKFLCYCLFNETEEEVREYFKPFWTKDQIDVAIQNTIKIGERAERFTFNKKQVIPKIQFQEGWNEKIENSCFPIQSIYKNIEFFL